MRRAGLALAVLAAMPAWAHAQVRTDTRALDALAPARKPAAAAHRPAHPAPTHHAHTAAAAPTHHHPAAPAGPVARPLPKRIPAPTMAPHPPPPPVIAPPPIHVPLHPPAPPPPVPVDPKAPGTATAIPGGTRIAFGPGSAALNPAMMAALHTESAAMKANPDDVANIDGFAAGVLDDPSTPRRLSLARVLAARAVLINDGVPSPRIYARALGAPADAGGLSPDRLDLTLAPLGDAAPALTTQGAGGSTP